VSTDPLELVASTADAAFGTDEDGRIVIWNKAAESLLGFTASEVLGKPCHELLCGRDVFGNRYCDEDCLLTKMVRRREAIRHFRLSLRKENGQVVLVEITVVVVPGPRSSQFTMLHLVQPVTAAGLVALGAPPRAAGLPIPPQLTAAQPEEAPHRPLTGREVEVLRLLADGTGTEEIADSLFISVTTVRNHVQNILRKLEVHSKLEAVSFALHHRLI